MLNCLRGGSQHHNKIILGDCGEDNGHLTYRNNLYMPDHEHLHLNLMQEHYDPPAIGNPGQAKTLELLQRKSYWPRMRNDVMHHIWKCHTCQRSYTSRHAPHRVLRPRAMPDKPLKDISTDFVTGLPSAEGYKATCVIVGRFTKQRHIILCTTTVDAERFTAKFIQ